MRVFMLLLAVLLSFNSTYGEEKESLTKIEDTLKIVIPKFKVYGGTLEEVFDVLKKASLKNDPNKKGLKINYKSDLPKDKKYSFDFEDIPLGQIVRYICLSAELEFKKGKSGIIISNK